MKKLMLVLFCLMTFCLQAKAQNTNVNLNAQGTSANCGPALTAPSASAVALAISGPTGAAAVTLANVWSGTVSFYVSADGGKTWVLSPTFTPAAGGSAVSSATANGIWQNAVFSGYTDFCAVTTSLVSGNVTVTVQFSLAGSTGGASPGGTAGGALTGSYPNPSLASTALASPPAYGGVTPAPVNTTINTSATLPTFDILSPTYGAVCDDSTDDTTAIQNAINAVGSTGGIVRFPATKKCKITSALTISNQMTLEGGAAGWAFITATTPAAYIDYQGTNTDAIRITVQGVTLRNLAIKYPVSTGAPTGSPATPSLSQIAVGGSCTSQSTPATYYAVIAYQNPDGTSTVSSEANQVVSSGNCLQVASPGSHANAATWCLYINTTIGNEQQQACNLTIGTPYVLVGGRVNLGPQPIVDATGSAAVFDNNQNKHYHLWLFTGSSVAFGVGPTGLHSTGAYCNGCRVSGFSIGDFSDAQGTGGASLWGPEQGYSTNNGYNFLINGGGPARIENMYSQSASTADIKILSAGDVSIHNDYFEVDTATHPVIILGDSTVPQVGTNKNAIVNADISNNDFVCNGFAWSAGKSVITLNQLGVSNGANQGGVRVSGNIFNNCGSEYIFDNQANTATANIEFSKAAVTGSFSASACGGGQCGWFTNNGSATNALVGISFTDVDIAGNSGTDAMTPDFPAGVASGSAPPVCAAGTAGGWCSLEGTPPMPSSTYDSEHGDNAQQAMEVNNHNTGEMPVSRISCVNVSPVTVNASTVADQNLMACTLAANLLNVTGRTLRITIANVFSTPSSSTTTVNLKAKICSVSGCASGNVLTAATITTAALGSIQVTNNAMNLPLVLVVQTAGATLAVEAHGCMDIDLLASISGIDSVYCDNNTTTQVGSPSNIDSTAQNFLQVSGAFSSSSTSDSMTERELLVEVLN